MSKSLLFLKNHILGVVLFLICVYVCYANYTPNTFLTGWDTLHPEFNYRIYWSRILDGVWQEHQGLGAVATQAHASEIPRVLILMLLDLFLPVNMVRYAYAFLMLILGPLGVYAFVKYGILKDKDRQVGEAAGFAGGLFYLFNLGTLQQFYVPLEMFLTHFGLLGWLFFTVAWYLRGGSKKSLIWFSLVTLFMSPQAHTATLFYAFLLYLTVFLLTYVVICRFERQVTRRAVVIIASTLVINLYWILPNTYFALKHGKEIQESKIHQLFSEEAFLQNKEFGTIKDTAILKSFLFNWGEYVGQNRYGDLLDEWKYHLEQPLTLPLGYAYFVLVTAGLAVAAIKKEKLLLGIGSMMLVGFFFIFNVNPPLGGVFTWLQETVPLFKEAFRFPFTKFSIGLAFCYSVFFSYSVSILVSVRGVAKRSYFIIMICVSIFASLYYYAKPMFNGGLISPSMRVAIPNRYFELFDYFDSQKEYGRVLSLPIHSVWGWVYHNWDPQTTLGYQGAGFLWFGIKQPLIDREFDRWNLTNEKSFMEISTAVYAEDILALERLLTKYKIRWLLLDESVVTPAQDEKQLFYPQLKALLTSSQKIKLEKDFGWGLAVYKYFPDETFVLQERLSTYYGAADSTFKEFTDPIFNTYGNYASNGAKSYPFVGMANYDESISRVYMSSDDTNIYLNNSLAFSTISADLSNNFFQYEVSLQLIGGAYSLEFSPVESSFEVDFAYNLGQVRPEVTAVSINGTTFAFVAGNLGTVLLDPSKAVEVALFSRSQNLLEGVDFFAVLESCSQVGTQTSYTIQRVTGGFVLSAQNVDACVTVDLAKYLGEQNEGNNFEVQIGSGDLARQEICILDGTTGLCANPPLKSGRTYFKAVYGSDYRLRLFARGKKAVNHEVTVVYGDLQFYQLINEDLFNFKPGVVEQKELVLDTWRFKKDPSYSGNSTKLVNNPRICNSGSTSFDKSKISVIGSFGTPFIRYESHGESLCDSFEFPSFSHASGAVLEIRSRNVTGMPLRICLTNEYSKRCDLYVSLAKSSDFATQYFVVPPMGKGSGYTVSLSNLVFGTSVSINDLEYVGLIPFPYSLVKNIHKPLKQGTNLLVYNQAFEQGWIALCGFKPCVGEHVLVNNWANGWVFSHPVAAKAVFIVYWPQILEYAGIMASLGWFLVLAGKQVHRR